MSGQERASLQYLVPAGGGLSEGELAALPPFHYPRWYEPLPALDEAEPAIPDG